MSVPDPGYFDYAASAPPYPEALERWVDIAQQYYANPSSVHLPGRAARRKLLELKREFCEQLDFFDGRLLLCSSGTEANNLIIEGHRKRFPGGRILIGEDVHDSIWYAVEKHKPSTDVLQITASSRIEPEQLKSALAPNVSLVCLSHGSHELGTIHPLAEMAEICTARGVKLLVDGAQTMGHIPVALDGLSCDYYSFSAHKFGGPRSVGGVLIRDQEFEPWLLGGKQEWGLRSGTENLGGLAAALAALKKGLSVEKVEAKRLNALKNHLLEKVNMLIPEALINSPKSALPGFLSLSFPGFSGREITTALALRGFAVSTGSACHADQMEPSRIILALGRSQKEATGTIRISMGRGTTEEAVNELLQALVEYLV